MKRFELFFTIILLPLDYLLALGAFLAAYFLRDYLNDSFLMPFTSFLRLASLMSLLWVVAFISLQLYHETVKRRTLDEFFRILIGCSTAMTLASAFVFLGKETAFSRLVLLLTWLFSIIFILAGRFLIGLLQDYFYRKGVGVRRVLVIGDGDTTQAVLEGLKAQKEPGVRVLGVLSDQYKKNARLEGYKVLGRIDNFEKIVKEENIAEVIQASPGLPGNQNLRIMNYCEEMSLKFKFVPDLFKTSFASVATYNLAGMPLIEVKATTLDGWFLVIKRLIDIVFSFLVLVVTSPILLLTTLAIRLDSSGSLLFHHERVGRNGKRFILYKFRTMRMAKKDGHWVHADQDEIVEKLKEQQKNYKLEDDPRITRVGRVIRKLSIDELPQFFNVLRGEMSVVGPRPYIQKELSRQQDVYPHAKELVRRLLTVKPGITGLWQVSGRSQIDFSERVAMDAYYATHANLWMDLKIILQTIPVVIRGSGAM